MSFCRRTKGGENPQELLVKDVATVLDVSQGAVQAGRIKTPPGYHPIDVEKEWGRLHVAILDRERLLRTEFER